MNQLIAPLRRFRRQDAGAATVETILWFPLFMVVFGLMLDVAMLFHGQAKVLMIVQEGNREYSIGRIVTEAAAETYIETQLSQLNIQAQATTVEIAGVARTVVSVPATEFQVLGYFNAFSQLSLTITAEHMIENWEV